MSGRRQWLVDGELVPDCFWEGPRPCSHDAGKPFPRPRPLSNWLGSHDCAMRADGTRWDGAPLEQNMLLTSAAQRDRVRRWHEAHG